MKNSFNITKLYTNVNKKYIMAREKYEPPNPRRNYTILPNTSANTNLLQSQSSYSNAYNKKDYSLENDYNSSNIINNNPNNLAPNYGWSELEITGAVKNISPNLFSLTHLTVLYLNDNNLANVPPQINELRHLTYLDLSSNKLRCLPPEMGDLITLRELHLNHNYVRTLPLELGRLFQLLVLGLKGNPLAPEILRIYSETNGTQKLLTHLLDNLMTLACCPTSNSSSSTLIREDSPNNKIKTGKNNANKSIFRDKKMDNELRQSDIMDFDFRRATSGLPSQASGIIPSLLEDPIPLRRFIQLVEPNYRKQMTNSNRDKDRASGKRNKGRYEEGGFTFAKPDFFVVANDSSSEGDNYYEEKESENRPPKTGSKTILKENTTSRPRDIKKLNVGENKLAKSSADSQTTSYESAAQEGSSCISFSEDSYCSSSISDINDSDDKNKIITCAEVDVLKLPVKSKIPGSPNQRKDNILMKVDESKKSIKKTTADDSITSAEEKTLTFTKTNDKNDVNRDQKISKFEENMNDKSSVDNETSISTKIDDDNKITKSDEKCLVKTNEKSPKFLKTDYNITADDKIQKLEIEMTENFNVHDKIENVKISKSLEAICINDLPTKSFKIHKEPNNTFTLMCYNILCDKYATRQLYAYCPTWALAWAYRKHRILSQLAESKADILCLQEVETEQFSDFLLPELEFLGYDGIFAPKSRAKTMRHEERKFVDGCAIFYKRSRFRLLKSHVVEFNQVAIAKAEGSQNMLNRVMTKDNIGLTALFETVPEESEKPRRNKSKKNNEPKAEEKETNAKTEEVDDSSLHISDSKTLGLHNITATRNRSKRRKVKRKNFLVVSTAHIHWDPEYSDVKIIQAMMIVHELKAFMRQCYDQYVLGGSTGKDLSRSLSLKEPAHHSSLITSSKNNSKAIMMVKKKRTCSENNHNSPTPPYQKPCGSKGDKHVSQLTTALSDTAADIEVDQESRENDEGRRNTTIFDHYRRFYERRVRKRKQRRSNLLSSSPSLLSRTHQETTRFNNKFSKDWPLVDLLPLVLCGDLNSLPDSGVLEFLLTGRLDADHREFKDLGYRACLAKLTNAEDENSNVNNNSTLEADASIDIKTDDTNNFERGGSRFKGDDKTDKVLDDDINYVANAAVGKSCQYSHSFKLASAYTPSIMPYTNFTYDFCGVLDYVLHSRNFLTPLAVLGPLDQGWINRNKIVGAPHPFIPSDHFPIVVKYDFKPLG
ncbi:uncharacterized protein LOC135926530 isoform X2 [Gordionus sp. m RMFG-2023]|uniref:uncharacterized protein LOC135926530 isoform X2 n=1 Tax=Gordionus sp. m RMFG-2023 TaxID=3053472 RepID=UPI0031FD8BEB